MYGRLSAKAPVLAGGVMIDELEDEDEVEELELEEAGGIKAYRRRSW